MAVKTSTHIIKGMQRDLTVSKFSPEFAFDALNIRITAREDNTLLSVTNEKGTKEITLKLSSGEETSIEGTLLGYYVLNLYLVVFTTGDTDRIYRLENKGDYFEVVLLISGDLNFNEDYPIEALGIYETENIQKVYWVDGLNGPRVINIAYEVENYPISDISDIEFFPIIDYSLNVEITHEFGSSQFGSGTVQYAFTYSNINGKETPIIYTTPLYYLCNQDKGVSNEDTSTSIFEFKLTSLDTNFDYIRVYSIYRSSNNATPTVKLIKVASISSSNLITFIDDNTIGSTVDSTFLLYVGGTNLIAGTMATKDNTLFLGNIKYKEDSIFSLEDKALFRDIEVTESRKTLPSVIPPITRIGNQRSYFYISSLSSGNSNSIKSYRCGNWYRLGLQFQNNLGEWSDVLFVKDMQPKAGISFDANYTYTAPSFTVALPDNIKTLITEKGYTRVRPMVVLPPSFKRNIICQGVLCPTLNNTTLSDETPTVLSSYFYRPFAYDSITELNAYPEEIAAYGAYAEIRNGIAVNSFTPVDGRLNEIEGTNNTIIVNGNIVTLNSPELELETITEIPDNTKLRIIGLVRMGSSINYKYVASSSPNPNPRDIGYGQYFPGTVVTFGSTATTQDNGRTLIGGINWFASATTSQDNYTTNKVGWVIHPWQQSGSLINGTENDRAVLQYNRTSHLRFSMYSLYYGDVNTPTDYYNLWNTTPTDIEVMDSSYKVINGLDYYRDVDIVLQSSTSYDSSGNPLDYSKYITTSNTEPQDKHLYILPTSTVNNRSADLGISDDKLKYNNNVISIRYKSSPHVVINLGSRCLPDNGNNIKDNEDLSTKWSRCANFDGLWLAELYNEYSAEDVFNTTGEDASNDIEKIWTIAGKTVGIDDNIVFEEGDTYFQRFDSLKTYMSSMEDPNSVTEILSFLCESYINLDGRYDNNRGLKDNTVVTPTIFNLINNSYTQDNNYFTASIVDTTNYNTYFPNMIVWSVEKTAGEEVDNWLNINSASNLSLDGDKGQVVSLNTFNNEIYCFQERGLSNILFNSRVQIPASDGVPIEITNGLKVSGKRYVSNSIGCNNKWSIAESPVGLYFIDNETNSLYLFNGQIQSLSDKLGFRQWLSEHNNSQSWTPAYENFRTFYDRNNNDVYFVDSTTCLCYSELLGQFTSFMSYEKVPAMFNIGSEFYSIKDNQLWHNFAGNYNRFYGVQKPYSITVVSNPDEPYDKIFNNIEFRADLYDDSNQVDHYKCPFDSIEVWNEYQHGSAKLTNTLGKPSSLKKKFRVWRANIPRDDSNNRDRIRNTWAYIKLMSPVRPGGRMEFHDMMVHYFI